jgi:hypothetical protein
VKLIGRPCDFDKSFGRSALFFSATKNLFLVSLFRGGIPHVSYKGKCADRVAGDTIRLLC